MAITDKWNAKLVALKKLNPWLTNRVIARALDVSLDRVNSWTSKNGHRCDHAFFELIEMKLRNNIITKENN